MFVDATLWFVLCVSVDVELAFPPRPGVSFSLPSEIISKQNFYFSWQR
jgi:hypothetical protein